MIMSESYVQLTVREFKRLKSLADGAMAQISDEQFFATPAAGDNSIAVIVKHVGGNLVSRWTDFLTSDGEKPDRRRDTEFENAPPTRDAMMAVWQSGWDLVFAALEPLTDADLACQVSIRGEPHSVMQAVNRQLVHYACHIGQIVFLAKHFRSSQWRSLSIPRGMSEKFNPFST